MKDQETAILFCYIGHGIEKGGSIHASLTFDEIQRDTFDMTDQLMNLSSDGTVVHGFFNCNRMNEDSRDEEPTPDFKSNQMMLVYATRFGKNSRSVDSTNTYISHLRKQIEDKALAVPSAF